ncbi:MAG TPA: nitroreductase family protein [Acidimicrobiales bacterium]|nr:nitroreductase family protein [Acidimicrobiales bacterium]
MELLSTLRTTAAIRSFTDDPVPDDVLARILDTARFAPNGGNAQSWRVVVVRDPSVRRSLRDAYLEGWKRYLAMTAAGLRPWAPVTDRAREAAALAPIEAGGEPPVPVGDFAARLDEVPALLVLLADLRLLAAVDRDLDRYSFIGGASVYPFAWSILLAARAEGLGGVITTMPVFREADVKALLHVPDEFAVAALLALGRPVHQPTKLRRKPVPEFTTTDRFDGPPLPEAGITS